MGRLILPSFYAGNIEYYANYLSSDKILIDQHEYFVKQSFRTRCHLLGPQGLFTLNIPVFWNSKTPMHEIEIDDSKNWRTNHIKSLDAAYNHSAYYEYYKDELHQLYLAKEVKLVNFNNKLHHWLLNCLEIDIKEEFSSEFQAYEDNDLRLTISPKKESDFAHIPYFQVYSDKLPFHPNLSILDLLFNKGPEAKLILNS
jgi:hypothetical protein